MALGKELDELDEDEDEEDEEDEEEEIDFDDGWEQAGKEDLQILRIPLEPEEVKIPLDYATKKYITFFIKELSVNDQLRVMESFFTVDPKTRETKFKWRDYYKTMYKRMVVKSVPKITWKRAQRYGGKFLAILQKYLPEPFAEEDKGPGGISEEDRKNS